MIPNILTTVLAGIGALCVSTFLGGLVQKKVEDYPKTSVMHVVPLVVFTATLIAGIAIIQW